MNDSWLAAFFFLKNTSKEEISRLQSSTYVILFAF